MQFIIIKLSDAVCVFGDLRVAIVVVVVVSAWTHVTMCWCIVTKYRPLLADKRKLAGK